MQWAIAHYLRNFEIPQERTYIREQGYTFKNGTTILNKRNFQTATSATMESKKEINDFFPRMQ